MWAAALALTVPLSAQRIQTGFLDRWVTMNGRTYRYQVYVPAAYADSAAWPVILFLHGAGERGGDGLLQTAVGLGAAIRRDPAGYPGIVVFPQAPTDSQWVGIPAQMAVAALKQTLAEYRTDPNRVYLTGLSMGGFAALHFGFTYSHMARSLVVGGCGYGAEPAKRDQFRQERDKFLEEREAFVLFLARVANHVATEFGGFDPADADRF